MKTLIDKNILLNSMDNRYNEKKSIVPDNLAEGFMQMEKLIKEQSATTEAEIISKFMSDLETELSLKHLDDNVCCEYHSDDWIKEMMDTADNLLKSMR